MKLIIDTCTFLWLASAEQRLSAIATTLIRDPDNQVLLSAASAWEIGVKHALGRLPLPQAGSGDRQVPGTVYLSPCRQQRAN